MKGKDVVEVVRETGDFVRFGVRITAPSVGPPGLPAARLVLGVHQFTLCVVATLISGTVGTVERGKDKSHRYSVVPDRAIGKYIIILYSLL